MSKEIILLKDSYLYKGKKYTKDEFMFALKKIKKNIKIIIAENEIFITKYSVGQRKVTEYLEEIMIDNEAYNENILTDYYFDKKNKQLYIYSLNEGGKINDFSSIKRKLQVLPIQFYIKNLFTFNLYQKKRVLILAKIDEMIYSIFCENNHITYANLFKTTNFEIANELVKFDKSISVFLDRRLVSCLREKSFNDFKIEIKDIGSAVYEKLYKI